MINSIFIKNKRAIILCSLISFAICFLTATPIIAQDTPGSEDIANSEETDNNEETDKDEDASDMEETDVPPPGFTGRLTLTSEGYSVNGIDSRRSPGLGLMQFNSTFDLFGLQSGVNVLYSTDNNRFRQSMNRVNFHVSWRWMTAAAGSVNPTFSRYSLSGILVTGGMIEMQPEWFSLTLTAGRTRRAIEFSLDEAFREPAFERWLYGARIGFGNHGYNHFAISGVYAYDKAGSIIDAGNLRPAKNLNLSPELKLSLFQGKFTLGSSFSVSAFTRDQLARDLNIDELENLGFLNDLLSPNSSTFVDFATETETRLTLDRVRVIGSYERIQPGYRSLGLRNIRSDQETYRLRSRFRLFDGRASLSGLFSRGRNNLLENRMSTINRQQVGSNLSLRISQQLNLNMSYMHMINRNEAVDQEAILAPQLHAEIVSQQIMLTPMLMLQNDLASHSISLTGIYQVLKDKSLMVLSGDRPPADFDNISIGTNYGITLPSSLMLSLSANIMHSNTEHSSSIGNAFNTSAGYAFYDGKLTANINLGYSRNGIEFIRIIEDPMPDKSRITDINIRQSAHTPITKNDDFLNGEYIVEQWSNQYSINLSGTYKLNNGNPLRLTVRGLVSKADYEGGRSYNELHAVLRYLHKF